MTETLELKGYVCLSDDDVFLEEKPKDEDYYYPDVESIGSIIADHFSDIVKGFEVSPSDWTRGTMQVVNNVFCRYFIAEKEQSWDEANEQNLSKMAGALQTENKRTGYSEYTITESWTEIFVGGHDLRQELRSYEGKYVIIRIDYNK